MPVVPGGLTAPTLPELVAVTCPECHGAKFHEHITPLGVDHSRRCETCFGAGEVEVCGGCGERPTVICGEDTCGCTMIGAQQPWEECEFCGDVVHPAEMVDGLCKTCWHRPLTRYAHEIPPAILEAEVAWGKAVGWLE